MIKFTIPGEPVAKGRPRVVKFGNFSKAFTPEKTVNYETLIKEIFALNYPDWKPVNCQLRAKMMIYMTIPKSVSKIKRQQMIDGMVRPTKKPDIDNILKIVTDALNSIAYLDDKQVVAIYAQKFYSDRPRLEVCFEEC